jgi:hypothetical protein
MPFRLAVAGPYRFADFDLTVIGNAEPVADHVRCLGYCVCEQMSDFNVVRGHGGSAAD